MTIEEMKARKAELGYTNETIAKLSGVPLGTVQKIFAGETRSPRYDTVQKLTKMFSKEEQSKSVFEYEYEYDRDLGSAGSAVMEMPSQRYVYRGHTVKPTGTKSSDLRLKPPKKIIGIADGKYDMPPDEILFDDEISEMFENI